MRRKWAFKLRNRVQVFVKGHEERVEHVMMKAFLWALYLPSFPGIVVEPSPVGPFKPDGAAISPRGIRGFWGEAGHVSRRKINRLLRTHPSGHFAFAKWSENLRPLVRLLEREVNPHCRRGSVDLLGFPEDAVKRFIDSGGRICVPADLVFRMWTTPDHGSSGVNHG